ncbi:Uncharacterized protein APZ42_015604 [Daphnia magna]|uniref:Uncharacterized protein n=1 Tax=Daphnia magna TaxID=35525 RepID=A0A162NTT4_9CRUS|nr:Uncharacterized protein APZ42_015604 [Daphnia magna]
MSVILKYFCSRKTPKLARKLFAFIFQSSFSAITCNNLMTILTVLLLRNFFEIWKRRMPRAMFSMFSGRARAVCCTHFPSFFLSSAHKLIVTCYSEKNFNKTFVKE